MKAQERYISTLSAWEGSSQQAGGNFASMGTLKRKMTRFDECNTPPRRSLIFVCWFIFYLFIYLFVCSPHIVIYLCFAIQFILDEH